MDMYDEVLTKCKNYPQNMVLAVPGKELLFPISPHDFRNKCEGIMLRTMAIDAVNTVQELTKRNLQEYTLILYGEKTENTVFVQDYSINIGRGGDANFSHEQIQYAKKVLKRKHGEVVYAHSHVKRGVHYNCFSLNDLKYLIRRAYVTGRDTYGMLITEEGFSPIKYSLKENEFFRIQLLFE